MPKILTAVWHMLNHDMPYRDLGLDYFHRRPDQVERRKRRLLNELTELGVDTAPSSPPADIEIPATDPVTHDRAGSISACPLTEHFRARSPAFHTTARRGRGRAGQPARDPVRRRRPAHPDRARRADRRLRRPSDDPVKGNLPTLFAQLKALPWPQIPAGDRRRDIGHGRRETRTGTGPAVLATLRNTAIGYHRTNGHTNITRATRRANRRSHDLITAVTDQPQSQNAMTLVASVAIHRRFIADPQAARCCQAE